MADKLIKSLPNTTALTGSPQALDLILLEKYVSGGDGSNPANNTYASNNMFLRDFLTALGVSGRNLIINDVPRIDQRNAGASQTLTAGGAIAYTVDRWYASCTGANVSGQQSANISGSVYTHGYKLTGAASVTGMLFGQRIESLNIPQKAISQNVTLQVELANTLLTTVTWTAYSANTKDTFSAKTSIATGTFTVGSTPAIYEATFNAGASAGNGVAIEFTVGAQTSGYLWVSGCKLEVGSVMTPLLVEDEALEFLKCYRYYYKTATGSNAFMKFSAGMSDSSTTFQTVAHLPVPMRVPPSSFDSAAAGNFIFYTGNNFTASAVSFGNTSTTTFCIFGTISGATLGQGGLLQANNTATAYIGASAEL